MKGLKKLVLATAVASAPFATQAMEPMSDSQMGDVTGQQGVTIELNTAMTIDQIEYSQDTNGSFLMDGIRVGGFSEGSTLNLGVDIDLEDNGDAVIHVGSLDGNPVQLGVDVDSMGLSGDDGSATLISGMDLDMALGQLDITAQVADLDGDVDSTGSLQIDTGFTIANLDVNFDVAAVSLEGFKMAGAGTLDTLESADTATMVGLSAPTADGGSPAVVDMAIGAGDSLSGNNPGGGDVLRIELAEFSADVWMPTINVGEESIGSVGISNLNVTDTNIAVYGRE